MLCEYPQKDTFFVAQVEPCLVPPQTLSPLDAQLDLLYRLRIIEKLQDVSEPHINHQPADDYIIDMLNWIASCLAENAEGDSVSVAFSAQTGHLTLYVANNEGSPYTGDLKQCFFSFLATLRSVLADEGIPTEVASRTFFRMAINLAYKRIQRKIALVAQTDEGLGQTSFHFTNLVTAWLVYRPDGEMSRGFVNMANTFGGDPTRANEYLIQSFVTVASQTADQAGNMAAEDRYTYLSSIITACSLLSHSTFFSDLVHYHSFRLSLQVEDRIFLHKILRRITRITAYKSGAMQFAYLGVPFIRSVIGDPNVGIMDVKFISDTKTVKSMTYRWPDSPSERIPILLLESEQEERVHHHSRHSTDGSEVSSTSSDDSGFGFRSDFSNLNMQLRAEVFQSGLLVDAWTEGDHVHTKYHSELQLIHYLTKHDVDVAYMAFGTSKPVCWTCGCYIDHLPDGEDNKWWFSQASSKVYHDWMIPSEACDETIDGLLKNAHEHMERIMEEIAYDSLY